MSQAWHAEPRLLESYAAGSIQDPAAYSLEAHLLACETCRGRLASATSFEGRLERAWDGIVAAVDAPRPGRIERALVRFGIREHVARLLAATPSLRLSWFLAVAFALAFAVAAAYAGTSGLVLFLVIAPLVPVAGVMAAYGPGLDPTYEIGMAAPMRSFRLLLVRSTAVLATSAALAGTASLFLPHLDWTAAAWLLPALGLSGASLALSTYMAPGWAAGAVATGWIAVVVLAESTSSVPLVAFRAAGQVALLAVLAVSVIVLARRRESFESRSRA